jgi:AcrR family transcriptional regulator
MRWSLSRNFYGVNAISSVVPKVIRRRQPTKTKERLIQAAVTVIHERGFDSASVEEIARRAGLTNGAIYSHFAKKSDLLVAALQYHLSDLHVLIRDLDAKNADAISALSLLVRSWRRLSPIEGGVIVEALAKARRDDEMADLIREQVYIIEEAYTRWLERDRVNGLLRHDIHSPSIARMFTALAIGSQAQSSIALAPVDDEAWSNMLLDMLMGLRAV